MHDRRAFTDIGAEAHARAVANTDIIQNNVLAHRREFVDGVDPKTCAEVLLVVSNSRQHRATVRPSNDRQDAEDAIKLDAMRLHLATAQEIHTQIRILNALRPLAVVTDEGHHRLPPRIRENVDGAFVLHQELERGFRCSDIRVCLAIIRERGEAHQNDAGELAGIEVIGRATIEMADCVGKDRCRTCVLELALNYRVDHGVARVEYGAVVGDGRPSDREGEWLAVAFSCLDACDEVLELVDRREKIWVRLGFAGH